MAVKMGGGDDDGDGNGEPPNGKMGVNDKNSVLMKTKKKEG